MAKKYIVELQKDEQEVVITHKYSPQIQCGCASASRYTLTEPFVG